MALELIGRELGTDVLDIHAGGIDLVFPHHEDEIAQSCAHTGEELFARFWLHGEFLKMSGTKMSKRFGNILTARDLREEGVDAGTVRLLFATSHYRSPLDFTDESLDSAREGSRRLGEFARRLKATTPGESTEFADLAARLESDFGAAMDDDLNTPRALAALFEAAREGNRLLDAGAAPPAVFNAAWRGCCGVLQVLPKGIEAGVDFKISVAGVGTLGPSPVPPVPEDEAREWAAAWAARRLAAKGEGDYAAADRIRELLAQAGWEIRDSRDGTVEVLRK